jgi:catechol 2,3-dioxygenase
MALPIHPETRIGHIHLKVADLDRAIRFYRDVLGFEVMATVGNAAAFLSAGGYHHHIGLNTWESAGATPPPPGHTGLYHAAILYPTRTELARAYQSLLDNNYPIDGTADHGVSEAMYLHDPDGLELYRDRPRADWPRDDAGNLTFINHPLDLSELITEIQTKG